MTFHDPTPVLRTFDEAKAREFYFGFLGFQVDWEHRLAPGKACQSVLLPRNTQPLLPIAIVLVVPPGNGKPPIHDAGCGNGTGTASFHSCGRGVPVAAAVPGTLIGTLVGTA